MKLLNFKVCRRGHLKMLALMAFFLPLVAGAQTLSSGGTATIFEKGWFVAAASLLTLVAIVLFFRRFTALRPENFESYTSYTEIITKIRVLGILSFLIFPLVEYYEAVYLKLYPVNWTPIIIILAVSLLSVLLSFRDLSFKFADTLPQISYYSVYAMALYKSMAAGMLPVMAVETACLILFSKLIFTKLKNLLYFLTFMLVANALAFSVWEVNEVNRDIYVSAIIQASVVSVALFLIEGSSNRKNGFGSKILESSNLFVLVSDKDGGFVYANRYLEQVTGLSLNQIIKEGWWNYLGYDQHTTEVLKKNVIDDIRNNRSGNYENNIKDFRNNTIYISWDTTVIEDRYLLFVGKNITETKLLQMEEKRRIKKVERYNYALNQLTRLPYSSDNNIKETLETLTRNVAEVLGIERVGVWKKESDGLVAQSIYQRSSNSFETGVKLSEKEFPEYFSAIEQARMIEASDVRQHPDTKQLAEGYFSMEGVRSVLDVPIFINGEVAGALCCAQYETMGLWDGEDINFVKSVSDFVALTYEASKRKELEREYHYILNNAGDIIYTTDELGNFKFINKTASSLLGFDLDYLRGKHFTSIIHPDYKKRATLFYLKQFKQKTESTYFEFKVITAEGQEYWVGQNVKLILGKGDQHTQVVGFQAVVRDITREKETKLALVESENNFRQINETIQDVFWLYDTLNLKYVYISPSCEKVLGMKEEYFYEGQSFSEKMVLEEDRSILLKSRRSLESKPSYEIEYRIRTEAGVVKWIHEKSSAIYDTSGKLVRTSGVSSDITEKKERESRLKELSLISEVVNNGVVISNPEGLIQWCNKSYLDMMGYSLEELIGKRPIEMFSGPETQKEKQDSILHNKLSNASAELLQYTKTGEQKWVLITNTPVYDAGGKIEKYIEVVTDITRRKALEREYHHILNNAGDVIYTTDSKGNIEFLNESISKILGYSPSYLSGKHFTYIIHEEDKKRVALFYLKQFAQAEENSYYEFRVYSKDGKVLWVGQNVKLIRETSGKQAVKGFQAILRDITRQKNAEMALQESENNFRQINETINDVFYLYNMEEEKYEYISSNALQILGEKPEYFYNNNNYTADHLIFKDREVVTSATNRVKDGEPYEIEYRIWIGDEITWINEKAFPVRNAEGKIIKRSGTCIDITQKKMQEKKLLRMNRELNITSEDLAVNNLLKEQLIYTNTFEEIAELSLNTLKEKIPGIKRGSLFLADDTNNHFNVFYTDQTEIKRDKYNYSDMKAYPTLLKGKRYIERNLDNAEQLSPSDIQRRKENIVSYILLPIHYSTDLVGALALEFESSFSFGKREMSILENYTSVLSVVVNNLNLKKELSDKSKDILSSLNYARDIQRSIFPSISGYKDSIKQFMAFYKPKDVVSGDFYLVESFDEYTVIALGDCTGHGVPGAFLTLLGSNLLQRIAVENKCTSPAQILEALDFQLHNSLNKKRENKRRDGMELGICVYNKKKRTLTFGGAGLFLLYYQDNVQHVINGDKRSIGDDNHINIDFSETCLELNGTEKFYLFSDGYRDQLGGAKKSKRFSRAKFFELLNKIKNLPPFQQEYLLEMEHMNYKGKHEQTDDISVIGFELKL